MSGKIIECRCSQIVCKWLYGPPPDASRPWYTPLAGLKINKDFINRNKGNTLVFVVSGTQGGAEFLKKAFEEELKDYLVFKSEKSVNGTAGHGTAPRNTLYILDIPNG